MLRWLVLTLMLVAMPAAAQLSGVDAGTCSPAGARIEWPDAARDLREEAERFRGDKQFVSRHEGRLALTLDGGRSLELADCPYGDGAYSYLYERFDEAGPLYVVRKTTGDDFSYVLVMKASGRLYRVYGSPIWSADKARFMTVACSLSPPRGTLTVAASSGSGLATEAEFPLPCDTHSCSARWDFQSWISVSCVPHDGGTKKALEFVLMRGNDQTWRKFGR